MVTIIIANENTREALHLCLLSIQKHTQKPYRVIVVDNSSTDGSLNLLKRFSWVKTIKVSGIKLGERHGKALDLAVNKVRTKYFLALDSDVEILDHNWLDDMVAKIKKTDAAFVGEVSPKLKTAYWGNFKERALPYCLLVNTKFFKNNNCTFIPKYNWKQKTYQSDVGADILLKAKKTNSPYCILDQSLQNKFLHYGSMTAANLFENKEWEEEFEAHLNNGLSASQKKEFRNYILHVIKSSKKKISLINHRIDLAKNNTPVEACDYTLKDTLLIKSTLNNLSSQLFCLAENYLQTKNSKASIQKLQEAIIYADPELKCQVLAKLASIYWEDKMAKNSERTLKTLINLKPKNPEVIYSIGVLFKKKNDFKSAETYFNKVVHAKKAGQEEICNRAYYHLGEIALNWGKTSRAMDFFGLCLKFNPNHQKASHYISKFSNHSL